MKSHLFLAKDVAEWIDYGFDSKGNRDTNGMLRTVEEEEKEKNINPINNRVSWFLTEDGLYEVLMQNTIVRGERNVTPLQIVTLTNCNSRRRRKANAQISALGQSRQMWFLTDNTF